jgi:hypothetical protein
MKGKKFLWVLSLSAAMVLASCNNNNPDTSSSDSPSSSTPAPSSESTTPSSEVKSSEAQSKSSEAASSSAEEKSSETQSSSEEKTSSETKTSSGKEASSEQESSSDATSVEPIDHLPAFNKDIDEGAVTRTYDERFDTIVEDFSGETPLGTTTGATHDGFLREVVDSNLDNFQSTPGAAIFKMSNGTFGGDNTLIGQSSINFRIRVAKGKLALKDLILGIRPSDDNDAHVYPINLGDALNPDGEVLPELTNEYQTLSISIANSIDDEDTVFPDTELKVLSAALGLHLYVRAEAEVAAIVEIDKVSYTKGDTEVTLDDFARDEIGTAPGAYWGPTNNPNAILVRKGVDLTGGKSYTTPEFSDKQKGYGHIVIDALGDLSGASVKVTYDDDAVKSLPFAEIKADGDKPLVNAVNGAYNPLAIDLASFGGAEGAKVKTVTVENGGNNELEISKIFLTDFEEPSLDKKYPHINTKTAVTFDNFERDFASLNNDWDASAADDRNTQAGINGFVSYSNGENISTSDGALHLPGVTEGYDEVTIGSRHTLENAQYLVFSIKGEEGADLSTFRFTMDGKTIWFNNDQETGAMAMEGVKTYNDAEITNPYVKEDGYTWYVVDLHYHEISAADLIDIYYSGEKAIDISSIFYANSFSVLPGRNGQIEANSEADLSGYTYVGSVGPSVKKKYIGFTVKGDGAATLGSFRVKHNGTTLWLKDDVLTVYDAVGRKVTKDEVIPEAETTYFADITTDGFPAKGDGWTHLEVGDATYSGKVTFSKLFAACAGDYFDNISGSGADAGNDAHYGYCGAWTAAGHADWLALTLTGNEKSDLSNFRIEVERDGAKSTYYANAYDGMLKNAYGEAIDLSTKIKDATGVALDFSVLPVDIQKGDIVHFHNSSDTADWTLDINGEAVSEEVPYGNAISSYSEAWVD